MTLAVIGDELGILVFICVEFLKVCFVLPHGGGITPLHPSLFWCEDRYANAGDTSSISSVGRFPVLRGN